MKCENSGTKNDAVGGVGENAGEPCYQDVTSPEALISELVLGAANQRMTRRGDSSPCCRRKTADSIAPGLLS